MPSEAPECADCGRAAVAVPRGWVCQACDQVVSESD